MTGKGLRVAAFLAGGSLLGFPSAANAQVGEVGVAAGIAAPVYEAAAAREPGFHLSGYVGYALGPVLQLRGELGFTQLGGDAAVEEMPSADRGDLRITGAAGTLVYSPAGNGRGVYGLAGAGAYALRNSQDEVVNPDGLVPGVNLGIGANFAVEGVGLFAQLRAEVPFSTFGSGTESAPVIHLPMTVGVRIPIGGRR